MQLIRRARLSRPYRPMRDEGFKPYWHQQVPPNDGGIALGQAAAYAAMRGGTGSTPSHEE